MRIYNEEIDKIIIEIIYTKNDAMTFGEIENELKLYTNTFSYETFSGRLKLLCDDSKNSKNSRYLIQPVLEKKDEGRGKNTFYSLTKDARIRRDLKLPILKSENLIENAYRILFRYLAFENSSYRILKDENKYDEFLQKLGINKNELQLNGKSEYNKNFFKVSKWIHQESGIKISHIEYLEDSDKNGKNEYYYQLPGISIKEFITSKESLGLPYGHLIFKENEVNEYFKLLEDKKLIEKRKSRYLEILNGEDRYVMADNKDTNKLKNFLRDCWLLHGSVTIYLYQKWKSIQPPNSEERIWYEHLYGRQRSNQILTECDKERVKFKNKSKNQKNKQDNDEDIQKLLDQIIISLQRKYKVIKNTYPDIIDDYAYFVNPLLNLVYPQFMR